MILLGLTFPLAPVILLYFFCTLRAISSQNVHDVAWWAVIWMYFALFTPLRPPFSEHLAVHPILWMDLPGDIFLLQMAAPGLLRWISHTKSEARLFFLARILLGYGFQIPHCRLQRMLENTWLSSLLTLSQHLLSNNL